MLALVALACWTTALPGSGTANGKGLGTMPAPAGVTVAGSPYRYVSVHPRVEGAPTVVQRIERKGGRIDRWWYLRGDYYVPAVAYDGSGGGLSADGKTLVLARLTFEYPPEETRFAILDTDLHLRHPGVDRSRAFTRIDLPGFFSFDAISPNGRTIYLIHYLEPRRSFATYEVRALDTASGLLLPEPIVDPDEPNEKMQGLPISRAASPDGRWAYTLYDGNGKEPFVHALDTVAGRAVCVDLPQLEDSRNMFMLQLRLARSGRELVVIRRSVVQGRPPSAPLLSVDTRTFAVQRPEPVATASSDSRTPWLPLGAAAALLAAAAIWGLARSQRGTDRPPPEPDRPPLEQG